MGQRPVPRRAGGRRACPALRRTRRSDVAHHPAHPGALRGAEERRPAPAIRDRRRPDRAAYSPASARASRATGGGTVTQTVPQAPEPFDLLGPLPEGTTVLEASAGTGKTFTIANLVARYVADGVAMEELLVVSFSRESTRELRERVRERLVSARDGLANPANIPADDRVLAHLADTNARGHRRTTTTARGGAHGLRRRDRHHHARLLPAGAARARHCGRPRHRRGAGREHRRPRVRGGRRPLPAQVGSRRRRPGRHDPRGVPPARTGCRDGPGHRAAAVHGDRRHARAARSHRRRGARRGRPAQAAAAAHRLRRHADPAGDDSDRPGVRSGREEQAAGALPSGAGR